MATGRRRSFFELVARPILFQLDPETAHNLVMRGMIALSWTIGGLQRLSRALLWSVTWALALSWVLSRLLW